MDMNDVIISLGDIEKILAPCDLTVTDAELAEHLANNVIGQAYTVEQVRIHQPIYIASVEQGIIQNKKDLNKAQASQLLLESDWVNQPDVVDTTANPHLLNKTDFDVYRQALRVIAVYPTSGNLTWPVKPQSQWSAV